MISTSNNDTKFQRQRQTRVFDYNEWTRSTKVLACYSIN